MLAEKGGDARKGRDRLRRAADPSCTDILGGLAAGRLRNLQQPNLVLRATARCRTRLRCCREAATPCSTVRSRATPHRPARRARCERHRRRETPVRTARRDLGADTGEEPAVVAREHRLSCEPRKSTLTCAPGIGPSPHRNRSRVLQDGMIGKHGRELQRGHCDPLLERNANRGRAACPTAHNVTRQGIARQRAAHGITNA